MAFSCTLGFELGLGEDSPAQPTSSQAKVENPFFFLPLTFFLLSPSPNLTQIFEHTVVVLSLSASRPLKVGALDSQVAIEAGRQVLPNTWVKGIHPMETRQRYSLPRTQRRG